MVKLCQRAVKVVSFIFETLSFGVYHTEGYVLHIVYLSLSYRNHIGDQNLRTMFVSWNVTDSYGRMAPSMTW